MMNATSIAILNRIPKYRALLDDPFAEWFAAAISPQAKSVLAELRDPAQCEALVDRIEREVRLPAMCRHHLYRKPWVNRNIRDALAAGIEQVVVLGVGVDSLSLRFAAELGDRPVFEIDTEPVIEYRRICIEMHRAIPDNVRLVPVDFTTQSMAERLAESGYDPGLKTLFNAEGVIEWLPDAAVDEIFSFIRDSSGRGSRFIFSFMPRQDVTSANYEHIRKENAEKGEHWRFGLDPDDLGRLLSRYAMRAVDFAGPEEFKTQLEQAGLPEIVLPFMHFAVSETD